MHVSVLNETVKDWLEQDPSNVYILADALGTKPILIGARVRGVMPWMLSEVFKVSKLLGCDLADLVKAEQER